MERKKRVFFNYAFSKDKSKVLYVAQKIVIPHVFSGNVFKQYQNEMLKDKREETFSKLIYFLSSTTDRK